MKNKQKTLRIPTRKPRNPTVLSLYTSHPPKVERSKKAYNRKKKENYDLQ